MKKLAVALLVSSPAHAIVGTWVSPCYYNNSPDASGDRTDKSTRQTTVNFSADSVTTVTKGFNREQCEKHAYTVTSESSYTTTDELQGEIDYTVKSIRLSYHLSSSVDELNDIEFCGFNDWKVNEPKEISSKKCFDDLPSLPAPGEKILDRFLIDQNKLFFGRSIGKDNTQTGNSQTRPAEVNRNEYLEPANNL
jgi:hypothetical protein